MSRTNSRGTVILPLEMGMLPFTFWGPSAQSGGAKKSCNTLACLGLRIMLIKLATSFLCVAVAAAPAAASIGQARYPVLGKDSALGALATTRRCGDDSTASCPREQTAARSAATTIRHVLRSRAVQDVAEVELFALVERRGSVLTHQQVPWAVGRNFVCCLMWKIWGRF